MRTTARTRRHTRQPLGPLRPAPALAALVVAASLSAIPNAATAAPVGDGWQHRPLLRCNDGLCLLVAPPFVDTDGDGVSDDDEKAAGTDPYDAASHPSTLQLIDLAADANLPSFSLGHSEIVVLPTTAPDGTSLTATWSMPTRADAMKRVGISADLLGKYGIGDGMAARVESTLPSLGGTAAGPGVRVSGIPVGLLSAGGKGSPVQLAAYLDVDDLGANAGKGVTSINVEGGKGGAITVRTTHDDESSDVSRIDSGGNASQETYNSNLETTGSSSVSRPTKHTNPDGSVATAQTEGRTQNNDDGTSVTTTTTTVNTRNPDGTSSVTTITIEVTKNKDGKVTGTSETVKTTNYDAEGNKTGTTGVNHTCDTKGECNDVPIEEDGGYENPDADQTTVVVTAEDLARVVAMRGGSTTTPGPVVDIELDGSVIEQKLTARAGLILVDPDADTVTAYETPNPDRGGAQPETDPRFPGVFGG